MTLIEAAARIGVNIYDTRYAHESYIQRYILPEGYIVTKYARIDRGDEYVLLLDAKQLIPLLALSFSDTFRYFIVEKVGPIDYGLEPE